jgi:hypothetical protein
MRAAGQLLAAGREVAGLAATIREACGDDDQAFVDTLDGETDVVEAARKVVRWLNEQAAQAQANEGLAAIYNARAKLFDGRVESARTALLQFMQETGAKTLPLPEATLTLAAGSRKVVGDLDPATLPDRFVRIKREADKTAIKQALEKGEFVPGASLSNATPTLQIRVK